MYLKLSQYFNMVIIYKVSNGNNKYHDIDNGTPCSLLIRYSLIRLSWILRVFVHL